MDSSRYALVSLASFAIFFFEVVCARFLGFTLATGFELVVIGLAMLGICAAGSFISFLLYIYSIFFVQLYFLSALRYHLRIASRTMP